MAPRISIAAFLGLMTIATARIVATYTVLSETVDEPAHIACGMEWLDRKTYHYELQHPPLARAMTAIGPYLDGARSTGAPDPWKDGAAILGDRYDARLALARVGILPFFWTAGVVIFLWARRDLGDAAALFATFCFSMLPPVLAHAGLATTDMAAMAMTGAAFLGFLRWVERPTVGRGVVLGIWIGAAVLVKFSTVAFLPVAFAGFVVVQRLAKERSHECERGTQECVRHIFMDLFREDSFRHFLWGAAVVLLVAGGIVWACYRFSFVEFWQGIGDVWKHNRKGHPGYLLGEYSEKSWWRYYPVVLGVKTPLALLALFSVGVVCCWRRVRVPLVFSGSILIFAIVFSHLSLGVRHVLPVYIGIVIVAGAGAQWMWSRARWVLVGLLVWMAVSSALAHPDYLPYFNELGGRHPENILVDSDLDWGQDVKRLARRLKEAGVMEIAFLPFDKSYPERLTAAGEFPRTRPFNPRGPEPGWNAAHITPLKIWRMGLNRTDPLWTERVPPTERVGKGILIWYVSGADKSQPPERPSR